jgi:hypothetical protein
MYTVCFCCILEIISWITSENDVKITFISMARTGMEERTLKEWTTNYNKWQIYLLLISYSFIILYYYTCVWDITQHVSN